MKTKKEKEKEKVNIYELSAEEHIALINSRKHSKTWDAIMRNQGAIICTDPNLL